jgi:hypothetical protein
MILGMVGSAKNGVVLPGERSLVTVQISTFITRHIRWLWKVQKCTMNLAHIVDIMNPDHLEQFIEDKCCRYTAAIAVCIGIGTIAWLSYSTVMLIFWGP